MTWSRKISGPECLMAKLAGPVGVLDPMRAQAFADQAVTRGCRHGGGLKGPSGLSKELAAHRSGNGDQRWSFKSLELSPQV